MRSHRPFAIALIATILGTLLASSPLAQAADKAQRPNIADFTAGMKHLPGFVELYVDRVNDRIFLAIERFDEELLHATAHASGLGSNPIGLDRGSLGPQHLITFRRAGKNVLVMARNTKFRAQSDNARERLAVAESFAPAVLAALPIRAETAGRVVVDATQFFLRDATGTTRKLSSNGATYRVDRDRSTLWLERTKAFPDNTEVEVLLTFSSSKQNGEVSRVAASGSAVALRQHHSFIRLPDGDYRPRVFDPRIGYFGPEFVDYAAPLGEPMQRHFIARHRLQKKDPTAATSEPVEPLVYYLDPGTPEPVLSALREGAMWWAEAFEAAGFENAFRVEILPPEADPMDVRYNMIHWVHRQTRGWSYGASIRDPRTGEIIKGNVLLGSLRVRQDHRKFVGLDAPFGNEGCAAMASPDPAYLIRDDEQAKATALARIRQLAAHEVGHTLGLSHNFAASTYGRASVMDYPAPLVSVADGKLDFSQAYDVGIGEYDKWAITYGYAQFMPGADEAAELEKIVQAGLGQGYAFLTDQDARAASTGHPLAGLWDNGTDSLAQLRTEYAVRAIGLRKFGIDALRRGRPLAELEDMLVPLYLHHRFQLEVAAKVIGGVDFRHAIKGDGQTAMRPIPDARQREALDLVLDTLDPKFLTLDPRMLTLIPPKPPGHPGTAERFPRSTGQPLDPIALARVCADLTFDVLLEPRRAARMMHRANPADDALTFDDLLLATVNRIRGQTPIAEAIRIRFLDRLMNLADDTSASALVRTAVERFLRDLTVRVKEPHKQRINAFLANPARDQRRARTLTTPPGSPIGSGR
ncbi:MAG: zinc-dependent metalloprotease [bacterium]|nr:zinc-dependent metalloprotease [bacterium]